MRFSILTLLISSILLVACDGSSNSSSSTPDSSANNVTSNNADSTTLIVNNVANSINIFESKKTKPVTVVTLKQDQPVIILTQPTYGRVVIVEEKNNKVLKYTYTGNVQLSDISESDRCNVKVNDSFTYGETEDDVNPKNVILVLADPLLSEQWHLCNNGKSLVDSTQDYFAEHVDVNAFEAWNAGATGQGINTFIIDSVIDSTHEDLSSNLKSYKVLDQENASLEHGTAVAGLIAAQANSVGVRGVAYNTALYGYNALNSLAIAIPDVQTAKADFIENGDHALSPLNLSLGYNTFNIVNDISLQTMENVYSQDIIPIVAAGNYYATTTVINQTFYNSTECRNYGVDCFFATNSGLARSPHTILVGSITPNGKHAGYSSSSPNLWVVAPGGDGVHTHHNLMTTDVFGCEADAGYAVSQPYATYTDYPFLNYGFFFNDIFPGLNLNEHCAYTSAFVGTSGATPIVTGIVANMLSVQQNLSTEQIKYILMKTTNYLTSFDTTEVPGARLPARTNSAGVMFSEEYGFGLVNAGKAVNYTVNECNSDPDCRKRSFDNLDNLIEDTLVSNNCYTIPNATNHAYSYRCEFVANSASDLYSSLPIQLENVLVDFSKISFEVANSTADCIAIGSLSRQDNLEGIAGVAGLAPLRDMVVSYTSSMSEDNQYFIKPRYMNFLPVIKDASGVNNVDAFISVNGLYLENFNTDSKIYIDVASACPLNVTNMKVKVQGYTN